MEYRHGRGSSGIPAGVKRMSADRSLQKDVGAPSAVPIVFIADDGVSAQESLRLLIRSQGWQPRALSAAEELLAHPGQSSPCCLLTELPVRDRIDQNWQRLIFERVDVPTIFLDKRIDVPAAVEAMKVGAFEVLAEPIVTSLLVNTIRLAIEHSRAALSQLAYIREIQERYACLSAREKEVMSLVVSGRLNKQVACELGITERTVKAHRGSLMRKMRSRSFAELVTLANGLQLWTEAPLRKVAPRLGSPDDCLWAIELHRGMSLALLSV
jgi:FixJ family two-component response regulator